jgi:CheY-like chemotaxis protein
MVSAVADLIWPLLVLAVVLFGHRHRQAVAPALREVLSTRDVSAELPGGFKLDVGGQPVTAQQVADDQREQTEKLRQDLSAVAAQVAELTSAVAARAEGSGESAPTPTSVVEDFVALTRRVLWVDDRPGNNAYEIAALKGRGVQVDLATSTTQALEILRREPNYDALVTDMGRVEEGENVRTAGLTLLRELKDRGYEIPVVVYASARAVRSHEEAAIKLGAVGATASSSKLLELLAVNYGPRFALRFVRQVRSIIERSEWDLVEQSRGNIDFVASRDGRQLGILAKTWVGDLAPTLLQKEIERATEMSRALPIWIVTPSPVAVPTEPPLPSGIAVVPLERLARRLADTS